MRNSLLLMAHSIRPTKAKEYTLRLKTQCDEKLIKDELEFYFSIDKATLGHIDVLLLWDTYEKGETWSTEK